MHNLGYFLKEAFISFKRNWSTSLGAVITIFLSLFVIGLFMIATLVVNNILKGYEDQVTVNVYIADTASQDDIATLESYIQSLPDVSTIEWVSKDQALQNFTSSNQTNSAIISQLDGTNPLPASIKVTLKDAQQVESVASQILANGTFLTICDNPTDPSDSVKYGKQTVSRLFQVVNYVRYASIALVALLIFVTFIFINNTIRLAILARRREIGIMRLVGASNSFIRGPFLMDGALQALIGSGLAILSLALVRGLVFPKLETSMQWVSFNLDSMVYVKIYLVLLALGLVIGLFGSALAMRRYLKV